jgi:hypothetical protein
MDFIVEISPVKRLEGANAASANNSELKIEFQLLEK